MGRFSRRNSFAANPQPYASLTPTPDGLAFVTPYDLGLVTELKRQIPPEGRTWNNARRCWLVDPRYGDVCARLALQYLGIQVAVPKIQTVAQTEIRLIRLEYLGACKDREGGESSAFGWVDGAWSVIVPESVLRAWFELEPQKPGEKPTLYAVLLVKQSAPIDEIRKNYRRLVRQYHPDVNHEPDAAEQFKTVQNAYEVLSDELKRRKYDAGLALQSSLGNTISSRSLTYSPQEATYKPPLRCGWVLTEGQEVLRRFVVSKILQWEDIVNDLGQVMVANWPMGNTAPEVNWR